MGCGNRFFKIRRGISAITEKFFVDTTVFIAAFNVRDRFYELGLRLLKEASERASLLYTSDYILDETISAVWSATKRRNHMLKVDEAIQDSGKIETISVTPQILSSAKACLRKYDNLTLSLTDWVSVIIMRDNNIPYILSFDADFDKVKSVKEFSFVTRLTELKYFQ